MEVIELKEQDYWKQTLKVIYTLYLLPAKYSTWCFPNHSLLRKSGINFHSTNCQFPKRTEAQKGPCPRPQNQLLTETGCLPRLPWLQMAFRSPTSKILPQEPWRVTQGHLSSYLCHHTDILIFFFLFRSQILAKVLLIMSASSTCAYGSFIAVFPFWASNTLGEIVLFSESYIVFVGEGFSHLQGRKSWFSTKEEEKS